MKTTELITTMTPKQLKAWRKKHGYSQSQLARALGYTTITVSKWERGANPIPAHMAVTLRGLEAVEKK